MGWSSLGTIDVSHQWQIVDTPVIGDALIRVSQTYTEYSHLVNKLLIADVYPNLGRHFHTAIFRKSDERVYQFAIPPEFADQGFWVRYLEVKHSAFGVLENTNWRVSFDIWVPEVSGAEGNIQVIDPGEYG